MVAAGIMPSGIGEPKYINGSRDYCLSYSDDQKSWGVFMRLEAPSAQDQQTITALQSAGGWTVALRGDICGPTSGAASNYVVIFPVS